jgi:hypothetical protein
MTKTASLTQARLKEVLHYDPETGVFTWAVGRPKAAKDYAAGSLSDRGYIVIVVDGVRHRAHRLAWLYVHGTHPEQIDHENHVRHDNRLCNLRETNNTENHKNISKPSNNKSGVVGVSWCQRIKQQQGKWETRICGQFLGYFDDFFEAVCKRKSAERQMNFHPNHGI